MHQYQLQRYSGLTSRHRCPQCQNRRKTFSLYIDTQTNLPLNPSVGKCDREVKCGYHYKPKQYFADGGIWTKEQRTKTKEYTPAPKKSLLLTPCSFIPTEVFRASLSRYEQNNLVEFLKLLFGDQVTCWLIKRYYIGTSKHWHGATVFWQVDINDRVRTGKIMLYNPTNAQRIKLPFNHITWVHTVLKLPDFELAQCFFGEHLLQQNSQPVAIVESEKTALIACAFMPAYTWIATGGLSNLTPQKCAVLQGRKVYLYPDVNAFDAWQAKTNELKLIANFVLFPLLEQIASPQHRAEGLDIADYLMGLWPL